MSVLMWMSLKLSLQMKVKVKFFFIFITHLLNTAWKNFGFGQDISQILYIS